MSGIRLVLDRGTVLRLAVGSVIAAQLIFIAGAVVGFALRGDGVPELLPATLEAPPVAEAPAEAAVRRVVAVAPSPGAEAEPADPVPTDATTPEAAVPMASGEVEAAEAAVSALFAVQLGAFRSDVNARQLQADLGSRGYAAVIVRRQNAAGVWLHHVQLAEHELTRREASMVATGIQDRERIPAAAVRVEDPVGS